MKRDDPFRCFRDELAIHLATPSTMNDSESVAFIRIASTSFWASELCHAIAFSILSN
jgi:hypothetical protein